MQHSDIRLLVLDIDGTIAGKSNNIREPVLAAISAAQNSGVQIAIATGRMYRSALRFYQTVGSSLPLIAYQGAWIQDPATNQILRQWSVPKAQVLELLDYFEQSHLRELLSIHFYINDDLYIRSMTPETAAYVQRSGIVPIEVGDLRNTLDLELTKVLALSDDTELIDTMLGSLQKQYTPAELYLTKSVATFFEATNPAANKGTAVKYLAEEILGLKPENVMTIGDNFNDLEMIQYAGIGVAMGDAPGGVQQYADWVAPSVEADGAAIAIRKFLL
ncbi:MULTISPECIES: Cof-type HAD-IIB family hydrolase [Leptolyngbya]|uniref:Cof-type HAD-IIB family hydrolase n=1 Tax=Leptolyngbya TaxID=47251 RepID=UPI0016890E4D|nr:HAD family hydrolase [Leptolyngbya sp. FACHB-1624]MBD1858125.1 HAD family phosphatase [Leptolyngbya sp. FACHB-1624]